MSYVVSAKRFAQPSCSSQDGPTVKWLMKLGGRGGGEAAEGKDEAMIFGAPGPWLRCLEGGLVFALQYRCEPLSTQTNWLGEMWSWSDFQASGDLLCQLFGLPAVGIVAGFLPDGGGEAGG